MINYLANPARFMRFSAVALPWCAGLCAIALGVGFVLASDASSVRNFTIGGGSAATHGILVTTGATLNSNIGAVEVSDFVQAGVRVEVSAQLTINAGTNLHNNGTTGSGELSGLHVTGAAHVAIVVGYVRGDKGPIDVNGDGDLTAFSRVELRANEYYADANPKGAPVSGYVSPS